MRSPDPRRLPCQYRQQPFQSRLLAHAGAQHHQGDLPALKPGVADVFAGFPFTEPARFIRMIVKSGLVGDNKIGPETNGLLDNRVGGEHGGYDAFNRLGWVTGLDGIYGIGERGAGDVSQESIDDPSDRKRWRRRGRPGRWHRQYTRQT